MHALTFETKILLRLELMQFGNCIGHHLFPPTHPCHPNLLILGFSIYSFQDLPNSQGIQGAHSQPQSQMLTIGEKMLSFSLATRIC